ncbi:hypothetical protein ACN38_g10990 [Penicillium nordicum]|uniref:Uncharacterized protein n=1 Tax=Penicillium nordicum TaxID=229535 RepID=A0A0M8NZI1_9EURO|nr:hypothetical protein ACN38_g10990 [Penicillium nordicum]
MVYVYVVTVLMTRNNTVDLLNTVIYQAPPSLMSDPTSNFPNFFFMSIVHAKPWNYPNRSLQSAQDFENALISQH